MEARTDILRRSKTLATIIRVYVEGTGDKPPSLQEFNLADFAGQVPGSGDLILDPASHVDDPVVTIWEVVARYHGPGQPFDAGACVRIQARPRPATEAELTLFRSR